MIQPPVKLSTARLLFNCAESLSLKPNWLVKNGVFVIQTSEGERYINRGVSSLNSPISTGLARNKYQTRLILQRHELPNIPFMRTRILDEAAEFLKEHGSIIVKPNKGEGSKNITIVRSASQLNSVPLTGMILEKYAPGKEMRFLVLSGDVIAVHESRYGESVQHDRSLERISYPSVSWDPKLVAMSKQICSIFGLGFAAIDFLIDETGPKVLEINSSPGFKWFHAPTSGPEVDVAQLFLTETLRTL